MGNQINVIDTIKSSIEWSGFINVEKKWYKVPLGDWAKDPVHKEAGRLCKRQFLDGMEGVSPYIQPSLLERDKTNHELSTQCLC